MADNNDRPDTPDNNDDDMELDMDLGSPLEEECGWEDLDPVDCKRWENLPTEPHRWGGTIHITSEDRKRPNNTNN
jgi:hypothetical protein